MHFGVVILISLLGGILIGIITFLVLIKFEKKRETQVKNECQKSVEETQQ